MVRDFMFFKDVVKGLSVEREKNRAKDGSLGYNNNDWNP
jgi:hypothetical protein